MLAVIVCIFGDKQFRIHYNALPSVGIAKILRHCRHPNFTYKQYWCYTKTLYQNLRDNHR